MRTRTEHGRLIATASAEFVPLVRDVGFIPRRVERTDIATVRTLLDAEGAVILTGWPADPESTVRAAAAVLGTRLRWLEAVRERVSVAGTVVGGPPVLDLHTDGADVVVNVHGRDVRLRDPDVDYVLILCAAPAPAGGGSVVADGYRLVERIRDGAPELYQFLTGVDIDLRLGENGVPSVCRLVEWTRAGRRVAPRERLAVGEILLLDNYRCPHGVDVHDGERRTHVLRCRTVDAL